MAGSTSTPAGIPVNGSLVDDGDTLGTPTATIGGLLVLQGLGPFSVGVPTAIDDTNGRTCGTIPVAADGSFSFVPAAGTHECMVTYTLTNISCSSAATELITVVPVP